MDLSKPLNIFSSLLGLIIAFITLITTTLISINNIYHFILWILHYQLSCSVWLFIYYCTLNFQIYFIPKDPVGLRQVCCHGLKGIGVCDSGLSNICIHENTDSSKYFTSSSLPESILLQPLLVCLTGITIKPLSNVCFKSIHLEPFACYILR